MKKQIIKNIFSSYFTNSLQMVLGILLVPFLIIKLGKEAFGLIALAESTIGIFEIIAISVRIALSRHATYSLARENREEFISYLSSGKYILIGSGSLVLVLGGLVSYFFPNIFHVPPSLSLQSKFLFALITIAFFITIPNIVYWSILYAKQRFDLINLASSFGLIARALGIFVLFTILPMKYVNIVTYGFIYLFMRLAENSLIYIWHKKVMPGVKLSFKYFKFERIKEILSFSGYTSLSSLSSVLYDNTANILINIFFGPAANAIYAVSLKIPMTIKNIFLRATSTLTPTVTDLAARNDKERMEKLFFSYSKCLSIILLPISLLIIFMSHQIINLWVGKSFATAAGLLSIQMVSLTIIVPLSIINTVTNAYAKVKIPSQVSFFIAVINVILGIILAKVLGLNLYGFALSAAICTVINSAIFLPIYSCRISGLPVDKYLFNAIVRPFFLAFLVILPLYFLFKIFFHGPSLFAILLEGCIIAMTYYILAFIFLINTYEKDMIKSLINHKIGRNFFNDISFLFSLFKKGRRKTAFYIGYVGYGNLGDEALREAVFELFESKVIFSQTRGALIRFFEKTGLFKFDVHFLGGGTLILRSEQVLHEISDPRITKKIIFGTGVANHIYWKNVPGRYGETAEWVKVLNTADYLSVRGPVSQQILRNLNIKKPIDVIGDPVLYFTRDIKSKKTKHKRLGVNLGTTGGGKIKNLLWGNDEDKFFSMFIDFIKIMSIDGWQIEFIPVYKEDELLIDKLLKKYVLQGHINVFRNYLSTQKVIDRMEEFDVFIGQKLHATILAFCANTPAVMVEYRPKCRDFMASIDMEPFNVRTDEFNAEIGKKLVEEMYKDLESIRDKTNKICLNYKSKLIEAAQNVIKTF